MKPLLKASIALAMMLSAVGAAYVATPRIHMADQGPKIDLDSMFPREFGGWRIDENMPVVVPAPDVQALLNRIYNSTLARTYVNAAGERVMLSVAYGGDQSDGNEAHRPEVCYPAQGFQLTNSSYGYLALGNGGKLPVHRLETQLTGRYEPVTYWIVVGDQIALTGTQQRLAQLKYGVRGLIPDGMLVRVSSINRDTQQAFELQNRFVNELLAAATPSARARIAGAVGAKVAGT
nr:exosortase-associated protein EpsI, B-type [uncultured Roseateles sp.]